MDSETAIATLLMVIIAIGYATLPYAPTTKWKRGRGNAKLSILVIVTVALAIAGLYLASKPLEQPPGDAPPTTVSKSGQGNTGSVSSLVGGLEERLAREPDDGKGWLLLAKSYDHLGRSKDALRAYGKAAQLGVTDPEFEASPANDSAPHDDTQDIAVKGRVALSEGARDMVDPSDVVFVIARSADGSPMPLAVLRRSADDLPFEFTLDDSTSMVRGRGISNAERIIVSAKISKSGDALSTEASLVASSDAFSPGDKKFVALEISRTATD